MRRPLFSVHKSVNAARTSACATACVALIFTGCGSIGEPLYPALHIPTPVTDLAIVEQGQNLDFRFTVPQLTTEGLPVKDIGMVDLRVGPSPPNGWNVDEWAAGATSVPVPTPAGPGPVQAKLPATKFIGSEVVAAVRITNANGKDAGWSTPKTLHVETPLADPTNFHVAADPKGVALTWSASSPSQFGPSQFRIFRKTEQQTQPVLLATANAPNYIDISAEFGKTYQYSIQAVRESIESDIVGPQTITPVDKFPPAVPTGLTVSAGIGTLEL
ncbi:MAG TPA: hypothetical protein VFW44_11385, partial [Bryobacteraceae bacterium]|nr:hypothetical protein [Bryobacteraceae bacterium]